MKSGLVLIATLLFALAATAQKVSLPLKEWSASQELPLVVYLSGDGGINAFSGNVCRLISQEGYSVTAINSKSYFWSRKTPEQAARDIAAYTLQQLSGRKNRQWVLIGYSFGADVLPFIVNRLPEAAGKSLAGAIMLAPSATTDFEIHLLDMFGAPAKRSMDVGAEINKMSMLKTVTVFGSEDAGFPANAITLKNYRNEVLAGGHHFEGNVDKVVQTIIKYIR